VNHLQENLASWPIECTFRFAVWWLKQNSRNGSPTMESDAVELVCEVLSDGKSQSAVQRNVQNITESRFFGQGDSTKFIDA
jgi:hypothetical protein